jgi:hypothetical protein
MSRKILAFGLACLFALAGANAADDTAISAEVGGVRMEATAGAERDAASKPTSCSAQCSDAHARCASSVRRARQQCARTAATSGRDGFDPYVDATAFCSYFRRPRNCGPGCEARFAQHLRLCLQAVDNPARLRQDCIEQERQANTFCRQELHDCELACKQ